MIGLWTERRVTRKSYGKKPYRRNLWKVGTLTGFAHFYSCVIPEREKSADHQVSDQMIHSLILSPPGPTTAMMSLLGHNPD